jgi:hypothetical protein
MLRAAKDLNEVGTRKEVHRTDVTVDFDVA